MSRTKQVYVCKGGVSLLSEYLNIAECHAEVYQQDFQFKCRFS